MNLFARLHILQLNNRQIMKHSHLYVFGIVTCILALFGCNKSAPASSANFSGYEIVAIDGSDFQKALKKDGGGTVVEEGYIYKDKLNGLWLTYHPDGRVNTMQHYIDGKLNGLSVTLDNRGQIIDKAYFTANQYDGIKATYRFGRKQEVIPYSMGIINGRVNKYYTNGKVMEENDFVNGEQHGFYRHFNDEGIMDLEYVYKNGEKVSGGIVNPDQE